MHPEFKNFDSILQKISVTPDKNGKSAFHLAGSSCAWAGLQPAVTRTLSASRSFQTSFKHNVGNPAKWYTNITIQSQILTIYVHMSIIFANTELGKSTHLQACLSKTPKTQRVDRNQTYEKNQTAFLLLFGSPHSPSNNNAHLGFFQESFYNNRKQSIIPWTIIQCMRRQLIIYTPCPEMRLRCS